MAYKAPTYITRSKHGVYYFQVRLRALQQRRLGTKSKLYRRSLKTKDRVTAIKLARQLWVHLNHNILLGLSMPNNGEESKDVSEFIDIADQAYEAEYAKSHFIRIALEIQAEAAKIPDWDFKSYTDFYEFLSPEQNLALEYVAEHEIALDDYQLEPAETSTPQVNQNSLNPIKLTDLLNKYLTVKKTNNLANKSLKSYKDNISLFIEVVELNGITKSDTLTKEHVNNYVNALQKLPKNRKKLKEFREKSLSQLINTDIDGTKLLSDATCSANTTNVKAFLDWASKNDYVDNKISIPLEDAFKNPVSYSYIAFNKNDLLKLFNSQEYVRGKHKIAAYYWVPLIALYTGARANEICQLHVEDIKYESVEGRKTSIAYFDINDEKTKTLKSRSSKRKIPVHPILVSLGFLTFVESQRAKGQTELFNDLKEKAGKKGDSFSVWFNRTYRPNCGVKSIEPDQRKVFHSFRHTLTQNIRAKTNIPEDKISEILGHSSKTVVGQHYAGSLSIADKYEIIKKVKYDIDLKKIRKWKVAK